MRLRVWLAPITVGVIYFSSLAFFASRSFGPVGDVPTPAPSLTPTSAPSFTPRPKVAVCVTGQLRSFFLPAGDPELAKGWFLMRTALPFPEKSVAELYRENVVDALKADVYAYISTREGQWEPKVNDTRVCEALLAKACKVVQEDEVAEKPGPPGIWKTFAYQVDERQREMVRQVLDMAECFSLIKASQVKYTHVMRVRPDMAFLAPVQLPEGPGVRMLDPSICCCGNEDTWGFGSWAEMEVYMERVHHFDEVEEDLKKQKWNAEMFVKFLLHRRGVELLPDKRIKACVVKPARRNVPGLPRRRSLGSLGRSLSSLGRSQMKR